MIFGARLFIQPIQGGKVMVAGLHGPDFIALRGKGFCTVAFHADICQNGGTVLIQSQAAGIIMVVVIVIIPGFYRKAQAVSPGNKKSDAGIENILAGQLFLCGKGHQLPIEKGICQPVIKAQAVGFLFYKLFSGGLEILCRKKHQLRLTGALSE